MNTFLQIVLALIPVGVVFVLLAIFRKKQRVASVITAVVLVGCIGAALLTGMLVQPKTTAKVKKADVAGQLELVYAVAGRENGIEQASKLLTQLRKDAEDSGEITLCDAYLCAAEGDWRSARVLYTKAVSLGQRENAEFLKHCDEAKAFAMQPLSAQWTGESAITGLQEFAVGYLEQQGEKVGEAVVQAGNVLISAQTLFDAYRTGNTANSEEAGALLETLDEAVKDEKRLLLLDEIRTCRAKLLVMSEQYGKLAEGISNESTYVELAIASELYMSGLIGDKDFNKQFVAPYKNALSSVVKQLRKLQSKISDKNDRDMVSALREKLSEKDPTVLGILADYISQYSSNDANSNKPKAHVQLAKIAYETEEEADAKLHLSAALGSAGVSDDRAFYDPLQNINRIIHGENNYAELKKLSGYVDQMLDNAVDPVATAIITEVRNSRPQEEPKQEQEETAEEPKAEEKEIPFETFVADSMNQFRISVDITHVDATNFPQVVATVNVDSSLVTTPEEMKKLLKVTDCGVEITDFQVTKSEFSDVSIVLCCDTSGSMDGQPIKDLRSAVQLFAQTASEKERLALVSFSDGASVICALGSDAEQISQQAAGLYAWGGTNMYGALIDSLKLFGENSSGLKYILLLSDGEDNVRRKIDEISASIGNPAMEKGVVVYSLGIGSSVDLDYLSMLASSTGGDFVYVEDSASLQTFYDSLRNQMLNQYVITFNAKDTLIADRSLEVTLKEKDASFTDVAYYTLDHSGAEPSYREDSLISFGSKGVYELDHNVIFKSSSATTVHILGFGFEADDSISVKLDGDSDRDVETSYVDSGKIAMVVPGNLAPGKYDVKISIDGMSTTLRNGITIVVQGSLQLTEVGPYKFTSYEKSVSGDITTLSGMVQLNGWLNFREDIQLQPQSGDVRRVKMTDNAGAYVAFHEDNAKGVAKLMAKWSMKMPIPALGELVLIAENLEDPTSDNYPVNTKALPALHVTKIVAIETPGVSLYPYKLGVKSNAFTTAIPGQDKILSAIGAEELYSFDLDIGGSVSNNSIDIYAHYERDADKDSFLKNKTNVNFGLAQIFLSTSDVEVLIDTANAHVKLDFFAGFGFMVTKDKKDDRGLGLCLEWKGRDTDTGIQFMVPSKVEITAKYPIDSTIGPVPVTYNNFTLGVSGVDLNKPVYSWTLEGGCSIGTKKLSSFVPGLAEFLDDPSILEINPAKVSLNLGEGYIGVEATVKLLEEIELANAKIEAGKISVTSALLGFSQETAYGLRGYVSGGLKWNITNCAVDVGGSCTVHLHNKFLGAELEGHAVVEIGWSIFKATWNERAYVSVGLQRIDDIPSLIIRIAASDNEISDGYYFMWNTKTNLEVGQIDV